LQVDNYPADIEEQAEEMFFQPVKNGRNAGSYRTVKGERPNGGV
jgi:hypothetical protein